MENMEVNLETLIHLTLKDDFRRLVHDFSLNESHDIKTFINMWLKDDFPLIFSGLPNVEDMEFFTEHALIVSKEIFLDCEHTYDQIGALFLIYVIYFSQPLVKSVQIRIEKHEFEKMLEFGEMMEEITFDISYAIWKLLKANAFAFIVKTVTKTEHAYSYGTDFQISGEASTKNRSGSVEEEIKLISDAIFDSKFDVKKWGSEEDAYNKSMESISKLVDLKVAKLGQFEQCKLLKDFVNPNWTSLVQRRKKRKLNIRQNKKLEKMVTEKDESDVEMTEPEPCSSSLPMIEDSKASASSSDSYRPDDSDWEDMSD